MTDARQKFLTKATAVYARKPNNTCVINKYEYVQRIQRLLAIANGEQKLPQDQRLLKNCCLYTDPNDPGNPKLCKANTTLAYVPMEDMYDVLHGIHQQLNHAGRNCMQRYVRTRYCNVSKDCIMMFLTTCDNCPRQRRMNGVTKKQLMTLQGFTSGDEDDDMDDLDDDKDISGMASTSAGANASVVSTTPLNISFQKKDSESFSRGQFEIYNMTDHPDGAYHAFIRYINLQTNEIRLRPLIMDTVDKIADALIDIFCDQGAPVVLQSMNGRQTVKDVVKEINKILPQCRLLDGEMRHSVEAADIILGQLNELMKRHGHNNWAKMLRVLQYEMNSAKNQSGFSPFEVVYGRQPSMGLRSSKLLDAIYEKTQSEEEIMEYLQDAELVRMSVFCQQAPIASNERKIPSNNGVRQVYEDHVSFNNHYSPITSTTGMQNSPSINQFDMAIPQSSTPSTNSHYGHTNPHTPIPSSQPTPQPPPQLQQSNPQTSSQPQVSQPPPTPTLDHYQQHQQPQPDTQQHFSEHQGNNIIYAHPDSGSNDIIIKPEGMNAQQQQMNECICNVPFPAVSSVSVFALMKKNDPAWKCACGFTVHNAMFFVSFVGIVISVASLVVAIMTANWSEVVLSAVSLITYFMVLLARMLHKPWLYLPLIVFHTASQIFGVLLAVLKLLLYFKVIKKQDFKWVDLLWFNLDPTLLTAIFCAFAVIDAVLQMYFVSLAWRAYQFMKTFVIKEYKTTVATIHKFQQYTKKK